MDKTIVPKFFDTVRRYPHLCKSCGMCVGVCPTNAVRMVLNEYSQYVPEFNESKCIHCQRCINCCPGIDITNAKPYLKGDFRQLLIGSATNPEIRQHGASGGVVTSLISWMLSCGLVNRAINLDFSDSPILPKPAVFTNVKQVMANGGSKYIIYPICDQLKKFDKHTVITTLPCQSLAMRKANLTEGYIFGLFCSKAYTKDLIRFVCEKEKINSNELISIDYRRGDWPGVVRLETKNKSIEIPLQHSYYTAASNGYYFSNQGCLLCPDYFNENADISFGDPWGIERDNDLKHGKTVIIVRTEKGQKILEQAIEDQILSVENLNESLLLKGHLNGIHFKKSTLSIRLAKIQEMGLPLPNHNQDLEQKKNVIDSFIQDFYINNSIKMKKKYETIFKWSKARIFLHRYFIHFIQTMSLKYRRDKPV